MLTINYLHFFSKKRKLNSFVRKFVKRLNGENQFYGEEVIDWIKKFMKIENKNDFSSNNYAMQEKKIRYLSNVFEDRIKFKGFPEEGTILYKKLFQIFASK